MRHLRLPTSLRAITPVKISHPRIIGAYAPAQQQTLWRWRDSNPRTNVRLRLSTVGTANIETSGQKKARRLESVRAEKGSLFLRPAGDGRAADRAANIVTQSYSRTCYNDIFFLGPNHAHLDTPQASLRIRMGKGDTSCYAISQ